MNGAGLQKVLVADDDAINRQVLGELLKPDYMVVMAKSGAQALEKAALHGPDLILLDVMMPQVDGWEMLRRVQERHGIGSIPVVMFSGKLDDAARAEAAERGAQGFIGKPFDLRSLIEQTKQIVPA
jgi:CheY-like chemotaxis protein